MIHDVDDAIRTLIERDAVNGGDVEVDFDVPSKEWAAKRNKPTVNVYLFQIEEELDRRLVQRERVVDDEGRTSARRLPPRFFELSYMVTVWTQRAEDDHRLLSAVLLSLLPHQQIPPDVLPTERSEDAPPLQMTIGVPSSGGGSLLTMWTQIGGTLRPALELNVIVPFDVEAELPAGPPVTETPRLRVADDEGREEEVGPDGAGDAEGADGPPEHLPTEETVTGGAEDEPGRVLTVRTLPRER